MSLYYGDPLSIVQYDSSRVNYQTLIIYIMRNPDKSSNTRSRHLQSNSRLGSRHDTQQSYSS